jgi:3-oxoacyl-[acyl-carrier-protein] synthase-3
MSSHPTGLSGVRIAAVAGHLPAQTVTNADLKARGLDTSDEWIVARTGIQTRRVAAPDESIVDLGVAAASKALAEAGIDGGDIDLVICATATMTSPIPNAAGRIASGIGTRCAALDINAGCAGSSYGLGLASDVIRSGTAKRVMVVCAERLTDWVDPMDRSTAILFGDGAGAFVVTADDDPQRQDIGPIAWLSDGYAAPTIVAAREDGAMVMQGQAVFRWATTQLAPLALKACERAGVAVADLKAFVPHQANLRIIEALAPAIGIDETRTVIARDVINTGNTSSASVPIALANLIAAGSVRSGDPVLIIAFGAGLSAASQVIRCP